jgi:hypothetical protein
MLFPHLSDTEAYKDTLPPTHGNHHHLTTYSDVCLGSQISNTIWEGIQLPLFKFHSMSRAISSNLEVHSHGKQSARILMPSAPAKPKFKQQTWVLASQLIPKIWSRTYQTEATQSAMLPYQLLCTTIMTRVSNGATT